MSVYDGDYPYEGTEYRLDKVIELLENILEKLEKPSLEVYAPAPSYYEYNHETLSLTCESDEKKEVK